MFMDVIRCLIRILCSLKSQVAAVVMLEWVTGSRAGAGGQIAGYWEAGLGLGRVSIP